MSATTVKHAARREPWRSRLRLRKAAAQAPAPAVPFGAPVALELEHDRRLGTGWTGASEPGQPPAAPWDGPDLAELTLTDKRLDVLRPDTVPVLTGPGPDLAAAPQDRPYVPQDSGPPSAWLRAIPQSGPGSRVLETLTGLPFFAGIRHDLEGGPAAGICLGAADDIWLILDTQSAGVLDELIAVLAAAREHLVYGGFRAPAVQPDPDAAEHQRVLLEELDAAEAGEPAAPDEAGADIETARSVLRAAGNLGFLSAALKQADGAQTVDVFVARATLASAVERGDGPAAVKAAGELVDVISELCDDETACAVANGIVPAGPEPEPGTPAGDAAAVEGTEGSEAA